MRKVFLSLVAVLLCGVTFAQTVEINDADDFLAIDGTKNYVQTADIILGDLGDKETAIIASLSSGKTYDGGNFTITYSANFTAGNNAKIGLFGINEGTITNLNLNANISVGGGGARAVMGLLCGQNNGTIEFCDVTGNVNSTVNTSNTGNTSTGLIVGSNLKTLQYCTGHGNVTGSGYAGGLVGSMGTPVSQSNNGLIKGCYFTGNVTANMSESDLGEYAGYVNIEVNSCAGGICGISLKPSVIEFCVAEAIVVTGQTAGGITTSGKLTVFVPIFQSVTTDNNYCTGTVNGSDITSGNIVPNIVTWNSGISQGDNYFGNSNIELTVDALNAARCPNENNCDDHFYFAVINGKVVLIVGDEDQEVEEVICEAPTGFTVVKNDDNTFTASWSANGEGANTSFTESIFILTVTGGNSNETMEITIENEFSITSEQALPTSENPYVFTIKSQCDENVFSVPQQVSFYVDPDCEANVTLSNVTTTSAKITWQGNVSTVKLGDATYQISEGQTYTFTNLTPATSYTAEVTFNCTRHNPDNNNEEESYTRTLTVDFTTLGATFISKQDGNFNDPNTWLGNAVPPQGDLANITINTGHKVSVNHNLVITDSYNIVENKGVLQITQAGQLINKTANNVPGIVEIVSDNKTMGAWTFVGAPFETGYTLGAVKPVSEDVAMVKYDYSSGAWRTDWAHYHDEMDAAEGAFAWPFYGGAITFSTHNFGASTNDQYSDTATATYALNNDTVIVTQPILQNTAGGYWMALANPYPAKLSINKFLQENSLRLQGGVTYQFNGTSFDIQGATSGNILMTEGFFVNFKANAEKKAVFTKSQMTNWNGNTTQAKSSANELIELTLQNGKDKVRVYFAHNEEAEQGYDIFDANKMFATTGVAEPYFVTDGIALIKEEVAELPYYATMNVRSQEDTVMNFVLTNLPEGYAVSIIDGEEVIDMVEGGVYSTEILTGENADRFKVLVKKNVGIADVEELDVTITNNNRQVNITADKAVRTEVYNILGQKVFETHNTTFVLDNVASGAYVVKVYGASASKTQKIVVE